MLRRRVGALLLRALGLPTLPPPTDAESTIERLRLRAQRDGVLFHGSARPDLEVLEPIRLTTDAREFGRQQAVFATSDPVWAVWFAIVSRDGLRRMTNGSVAPAGAALYPRSYFFAVDPLDAGRFRHGYVYVLPRDTFRVEPPIAGLLDTAQLASEEPVRPIERIAVTPRDFPLLGEVFDDGGRSEVLTILRAGRLRRGRGR